MGQRMLRAYRTTHAAGLAAVALLVVPLAIYLATLPGDRAYSVLNDGILGNAVLALPAVVCLVRAAMSRSQRLPYLLIGLAAAAFTGGNIAYITHVQYLDPVPYPSVADIGYLAPYPLLLTAVLLLARRELRTVSPGPLMDGLIGALACAGAGSVLTVHPVLASLEGSGFVRVIGATYPVADLTLTALIVGIVALKGGWPGGSWIWLCSGIVTFAVADSVYLYRVAADTYQVGTLLDGLWAVGLNLMAIGVLLPHRPAPPPAARTQHHLVVSNLFSGVAIAILIYGSLSSRRLPVYAVVLASLTLVTAVRRVAYGFSALRLLSLSQRQARTDELTQLPNRRHFYEQVQRALQERGEGDALSLIILDLDGFKAVNDAFGHHTGDELLRQIGPRLRSELPAGDVLARLGGDEFAALLHHRGRDGALGVAERLRLSLNEPFLIEGTPQVVTASMGVAECPSDGADLTALLQRADAAMFDAKNGQWGVAAYDRERHGGTQDTINVYEALAQRQLVVHYQPQFHAADGRLAGAEALVRWQHPVRGLLMPDAFLPFFEHAGLMPELTLEVLEISARDQRRLRLAGGHAGHGGTSGRHRDSGYRLSVNVAPSVLLHDGLAEAIGGILDRYDLDPGGLTIEITENVLLLDVDRSLRTLIELREMGVHLSLDDYGTGYCSLTYLRDLPLHEVKIDRSFVMGLAPETVDAAIVASTIELAHQLNLRTVAEGVETETGLQMLRQMGCDVVQGYLLGRPAPVGDLFSVPGPPAQRSAQLMVATDPESTR